MEKQVTMPLDLYVIQMVSILNEMEKSCFRCGDDDVLFFFFKWLGAEEDDETVALDIYFIFALYT